MQKLEELNILCFGKLQKEAEEKLSHCRSLNIADRLGPFSAQEMAEKLQNFDVVISEPLDNLRAEVLSQCPALKMIAQRAVGFDNVDLDYATKNSILVSNTPGVLDNATADLAFALLLAAARRIVEGDNYVRQGKWQGFENDLLLGREISGKTLGIIGMGRIGQAMARRAHGFGLDIIYTRSNENDSTVFSTKSKDAKDAELLSTFGARRVALGELLKESDFITVHCPLNASTTSLLGAREFKMMRKHCLLINTSRGKVVDQDALICALQEKELGGAALDVFVDEPNVPQALIDLPNVVLAPHIGSATTETRLNMTLLAVNSIVEAFSGILPKNVLNGKIYQDFQNRTAVRK